MSSELIRAALRKWPHEHAEPLAIGECDNIVWATVKSPMIGVNGYVLISAESHPWSTGFPDDLEDLIDVHGGITYVQHPWLGFDTGHAWDYWPPEYDRIGIQQHGWPTGVTVINWTPELVAEEAKRLATQIVALGNRVSHRHKH